jgi:predicted RND superfamily exporter protein
VAESKRENYQYFQALLRWVQSFPKTAFGLSCFFILVCGWALQYSKLEIDIYDVYEPGFQSSVDLHEIREFYGDNSQMLLSFEFKDVPKAGELCKILRWTDKLSRFQDIKNVTSLWTIRSPKVQDEKLWYPKTLSDPCESDPSEAIDLHSRFQNTFFSHLMASKGNKDIVFDVSFTGTESNANKVQNVIDETEAFIHQSLKDVKVSYLGLSASRYYFKKIIVQDSIFTLLVLVIIVLLLRLIYGTWTSGIYLSLTIVLSTIVLYGTLALTGISVNILTNNLFLMTAVAGTADFMFVTHYQLKGSYQDSLTKLIAPCFFTTLTTCVGFLSLNSSDLSLIRQFGNGAALGSMAEWVMLFVFLPSYLKIVKKEKIWVNPDKAANWKWITFIENLSMPKFVLWGLNILMILSIPAFFFLNDQDSVVKNLPSSHVMRKGYENFKKKFSWEGQVHLYFPDRVPADDVRSILDQVKKSSLVYKIENPEDLADQWTKDLPPLKQDLIRRELMMTPLWERYYSDAGQLRVPLYLYEQDLHSLRKLRDEVQNACKDKCRLAGQRIVYLEYGEKISKTMIESFAVSIFLVIGILYWLLYKEGKTKHFIPVVHSSLMGPLVILALIGIFQIPVTLVTSIFLAIMVGLAGDNAIQFMLADSDDLEKGIESRATATISITLVMMAGSALFLFQSLLPMKILGGLFVSGFFINLTGDFWGLKKLLSGRS